MVVKDLEIVNKTRAVNKVKDQSENVVNNVSPEGCYGYSPYLIIKVIISKCGKSSSRDKPEHVDSLF